MNRIVSLVIVIGAGVAFARSASATHKSWILQDGGTSCRAVYSGTVGAQRYVEGAVTNVSGSRITLVCPIALAGRFASQPGNLGPASTFPMATWAAAEKIERPAVFGYDGSSTDNFSCTTYALTSSGSVYYGSTKTISAVNQAVRIDLTDSSASWGSTMGSGASLNVRALGHICRVPPNSTIYGYRVKICQRSTTCSIQ